jgi:DNA-binding MarR family transcriptional regulator
MYNLVGRARERWHLAAVEASDTAAVGGATPACRRETETESGKMTPKWMTEENLELKSELVHVMFRLKGIGAPGPGGRRMAGLFRCRHGVNMAELAFMTNLLPEGEDGLNIRHSGLSEMREYLCVSKAAVSQMVGALERKGFVTRETDPGNRRRIIVSLTEQGEEALKAVHQEFDYYVTEIIARFGETDMRQLIRLVGRLADTIAEVGDNGLDTPETACAKEQEEGA